MAPLNVTIGDPDLDSPTIQSERGACGRCAQWEKCLFNVRRYGGFKGTGHHNIGYRLITDNVEGNAGKEGYASCETFVDILQDRMLSGRAQRELGKDGEIVMIVAQEGEEIVERFEVGFNSRNEIVKPQPHLIEAYKAAGYKVDLESQGGALLWKHVEIKTIVPKWAPISASRDNYSQRLMDKTKDFDRATEDAENAAWEAARKRQAAETEKPAPVVTATIEPVKAPKA